MNYCLDIFGQQPGLNKLYTQLCFCFATNDSTPDQDAIVQTLQSGLMRLSASFPWMAGAVVYDNDTSAYKVESSQRVATLAVKDMRDQLPSMQQYRTAGFPAALLQEDLIAPSKTFRQNLDEPAPVMLLQATFIAGGVLLVVIGLHSCMDMAGLGELLRLYSQACRNEPFTPQELSNSNLSPKDIIPLNRDNPPSSHQDIVQVKKARPESGTSTPSPVDWAYFVLSGEALAALKSHATETATSEYVSTDDALSAFIWQRVSSARLHRLSGVTETDLTRTVDTRRFIGLSSSYMGNAATKTRCGMPISKLISGPLGCIASSLRRSLANVDNKIREEATLLSRGKTPTKTSVDPSTGINLSSWAKEKCYDLDFGELLGMPEAVRRPTFEAWEGLVYLMPKKSDGEVAVLISLRQEDMEILKDDSEFSQQFGRYVG